MNRMNRKPFFAYRSFWPELETMRRMGECGIDTFCIFPANTLNSLGEPYCKYPPIWRWYDTYDFSPMDRQIADIQAVCEQARFICMIDLNAPEWLVKNRICQDSFGELGRVVCNPGWRAVMGDFLAAFLDHAERRHGTVIDAYVLAGGHTCEWMDFSLGTESPSKTVAFQDWCRRNALPVPDDIPPPAIRNRLSHDGVLRDPKTDGQAIAYWKFCSEAVVDAIAVFVEQTRARIPEEKSLGAFYGYAIELNGDRFLSLAHLAYEKALDLPGLDFLISPGTYRDRAMGGGSGFMVPNGTIRSKGKAFMHECDQRTHTYNPHLSPYVSLSFPHWEDEAATLAGLRRELSLALVNRASLWWFDMWGGFYQGEAVFNNFRLMRAIWDAYSEIETTSVAEIAMVIDPDGCYYLHPTNADAQSYTVGMQENSLLHGIRDKLNRMGAPYDVLSFNDIPHLADFSRYRLVIFCTPFEIDANKARVLRTHVLRDNRHVVWLQAPGVSDGETWTPGRMRDWCGVPFGTQGVSRVDRGGWQSIHVSSPALLDVPTLRTCAEQAGVHRYCQEPLPVYANSRLLAVHSAEGGILEIQLPKTGGTIRELFSNTVVAHNTNRFRHTFPTPGTCLFDLDAGSL